MLDRIYIHYTKHGLGSLILSAIAYVYNNYVAPPERLAKSVELIQPSRIINATYKGVSDASTPKHLQKTVGRIKIDPRKVYFFNDVSILPTESNSTIYSGIFPFDPITTNPKIVKLPRINWNFYIRNIFSTNKKPDTSLAILISEKHSLAYSHWLTEVITQFRLIDELGYDKNNLDIVFMWGGREKKMALWQKETMEYFEFAPDFLKSDGLVRASKLVVPSYTTLASYIPNYPSSSDLKWIRERAHNLIDSSAKHPKRLFVSRQKSGRRKISNLVEIENILTKYGFDIIYPENLSVKEQINLFSTAEVIMGPHGGGLMNMIFSIDALIIELLADHEACHHQFVLSNLLGLDYEFILCETVQNSHNKKRHMDLIIDPNRLKFILEHYCGEDI